MTRPARKALISGCGIAGPVVALFLQRAGIEAEIYEARAESTDYGGNFLNMACNGLGVLGTLGLDEQVSRQGSPSHAAHGGSPSLPLYGRQGVLSCLSQTCW